jgi:hypothetical protein
VSRTALKDCLQVYDTLMTGICQGKNQMLSLRKFVKSVVIQAPEKISFGRDLRITLTAKQEAVRVNNLLCLWDIGII